MFRDMKGVISGGVMKKHIIIIVVSIFVLLSCSASKVDREQLAGTFNCSFESNGFNHEYSLELRSDNTFAFTERVAGASPGCDGQWKIVDDNITLLCNEPENVYEQLTNGYMNKRVHKLKVINSNNLEYEGVTLKRIEQ
jgi:hypothetical protein